MKVKSNQEKPRGRLDLEMQVCRKRIPDPPFKLSDKFIAHFSGTFGFVQIDAE